MGNKQEKKELKINNSIKEETLTIINNFNKVSRRKETQKLKEKVQNNSFNFEDKNSKQINQSLNNIVSNNSKNQIKGETKFHNFLDTDNLLLEYKYKNLLNNKSSCKINKESCFRYLSKTEFFSFKKILLKNIKGNICFNYDYYRKKPKKKNKDINSNFFTILGSEYITVSKNDYAKILRIKKSYSFSYKKKKKFNNQFSEKFEENEIKIKGNNLFNFSDHYVLSTIPNDYTNKNKKSSLFSSENIKTLENNIKHSHNPSKYSILNSLNLYFTSGYQDYYLSQRCKFKFDIFDSLFLRCYINAYNPFFYEIETKKVKLINNQIELESEKNLNYEDKMAEEEKTLPKNKNDINQRSQIKTSSNTQNIVVNNVKQEFIKLSEDNFENKANDQRRSQIFSPLSNSTNITNYNNKNPRLYLSKTYKSPSNNSLQNNKLKIEVSNKRSSSRLKANKYSETIRDKNLISNFNKKYEKEYLSNINFEKRIKLHKNEKLITDCKEADQINLNIKDNSEQYFNRIRQPNYNYQSGIESYFNKFVSSEGQIDPIYNNPNFLFEFDEVNANDNEVKYLNSENVEQNFSEKEIKKLLKNKEGYIKINIKDWEKEVLQSERIKVIANEYKYKIINDEESLISDKINSRVIKNEKNEEFNFKKHISSLVSLKEYKIIPNKVKENLLKTNKSEIKNQLKKISKNFDDKSSRKSENFDNFDENNIKISIKDELITKKMITSCKSNEDLNSTKYLGSYKNHVFVKNYNIPNDKVKENINNKLLNEIDVDSINKDYIAIANSYSKIKKLISLNSLDSVKKKSEFLNRYRSPDINENREIKFSYEMPLRCKTPSNLKNFDVIDSLLNNIDKLKHIVVRNSSKVN